MLAVGRALMLNPKLILLDEPAAGMNATETATLRKLLERILDGGVTLLLIEHDMQLVFRFAKTISVLVNGGLFVEGPAAEIARDERVKKVYLGEEVVHV